MNPKAGKSNVKIITIGVLALLISWCLLQAPAWIDNWMFQFYQNQQTVSVVKAANEINPFLTGDHSFSNHLIFQDLLIKAGAKERLIEQYKQTADEYSTDANVIAYYARVVEDSSLKQSLLKKAAELDPNEPAVILLQAEQELNGGKPLEALQIASALDSNHWYKHALRAKAWHQAGNVSEAKNAFDTALACEGVPVSVRLDYAQFLLDNNIENAGNPFVDWDEDAKIKQPLAYAYDVYLSGKDVSLFEDQLDNAVEYNPKALLILAKAALKQDQVNTADYWLNQADRLEPDNQDIIIYRRIIALKQGNEALADSLLQTGMLKKGPLSEQEHARLGLILWNAGQTEYAMKHFQHAGALVPVLPGIAIALAEFYMEKNDCKTASLLIHKNVDAFALERERAFALAAQSDACGELETAAELYGAVLDRDYHDIEARVHLADIYVKRGEKDRAILLYDGYFKSNPKNAYCLAKVAEIHHHFNANSTAQEIVNYVLQNEAQFDDVSYIKELNTKWNAEQSKP